LCAINIWCDNKIIIKVIGIYKFVK